MNNNLLKNSLENEIEDFFIEQGLYDEKFFDFIKTRVKQLPYDAGLEWFGCFPILKDGILNDIRLLVPEIKNEQNILVNIHEYTHAIELFNELGKEYIERREERENKAIEMEKIYKKKKSIE